MNTDTGQSQINATMKAFSVLLVCTLVASCVWMVQARNIKVKADDEDALEIKTRKLPGLCRACKWAVNKVKKSLAKNATAKVIKAKLNSVCNKIGFLKSLCRKFIRDHLADLVQQLSTSANVRTICVNLKACKWKGLVEQPFDGSEEDLNMEMDEYFRENQD